MKYQVKPQKNFAEVILAVKFGWILLFIVIFCVLVPLTSSDKPVSESTRAVGLVMPFILALGIMVLERTVSGVDIARDIELKTEVAWSRKRAIKVTHLLFNNLVTWFGFFFGCLAGTLLMAATDSLIFLFSGLLLLSLFKFILSCRIYYFTNVYTGLEQFQAS